MSDAQGRRLDSWKAIAGHLGRTCRTAQRWHLHYRLPVHQLGTRGVVFAYTDEIDDWLRQDGRKIQERDLNSPGGSLIEMPALGNPGLEETELSIIDPPEVGDRSLARIRVAAAYDMWHLLSRKSLRCIAQSFWEAINLDPHSAGAYAGLSQALVLQGMLGSISLGSAYCSARAGSEKAFKLDPGSSETNCAIAWLKMSLDRDWVGAQALFDDQLVQNPLNTRVMMGRALLYIAQGVLDRASELLYAASELNALSSLFLGLHSWSEYLTGEYTEVMEHVAEAHASGRSGPILAGVEALTSVQVERPSESMLRVERLLREDPDNEPLRGVQGYLAARLGDVPKARAILDSLTSGCSHARYRSHYAIALTHLGLDQKREAVRSIVSSYKDGSLWSLGFPLDPLLGSLNREIEFKDLVRSGYPLGSAGSRTLSICHLSRVNVH